MNSFLSQIAEYLFLKKKDPNRKPSEWEKYMHGMNRISIVMALIAVIIIIVRKLLK
jgi:purine-cytosine permease-like protein